MLQFCILWCQNKISISVEVSYLICSPIKSTQSETKVQNVLESMLKSFHIFSFPSSLPSLPRSHLTFTSLSPGSFHPSLSHLLPSLFNPILSLDSWSSSSPPPSQPQWKHKSRDSSSESDGALTGWSLCPSWGHTAVAQLPDAYQPKTHTKGETAGMQPPTQPRLPTFRELQRDGTCGFTHTSALTCGSVWTAFYE